MKYSALLNNNYSENKYTLISFRKKDLQHIRKWRNEQIDILRQDHLLTDKEQETYYVNVIKPSFTQPFPKLILFSFLYDEDCIGYGGFTNIDWNSSRAEISFLIDTDRVKNDVTYDRDFSTFLFLLKKIAFSDLNFNRLFTETFDIRRKHVNILERAGFLKEGIMREHVFIKGQKIDSLIHGFLRKYYDV